MSGEKCERHYFALDGTCQRCGYDSHTPTPEPSEVADHTDSCEEYNHDAGWRVYRCICEPSEVAETTAGEREVNIIQRIVNAWDCCGTCAGGVLAGHDRANADRERREVGERIAQAIEADVDRMRSTGGGIYTADFAAGAQSTARIARDEAAR